MRRTAHVGAALAELWWRARTVAPHLPAPERRALAQHGAQHALGALAARVRSFGPRPAPIEPFLVVANHVSWLDVFVLAAQQDARFVAKAETRAWPVAGTITRGFDSIFIVRGSIRDAYRVKNVVADALRARQRVVVFPEATTTAGHGVRPFRPALFQAAIDAGVRVLPIAIRYPTPEGLPNPAAAFIDDMSFGGSLVRVLRERDLRIELHWGPPLSPVGRTRRELAAASHEWIASVLAGPAWIEPSAAERVGRRRGRGDGMRPVRMPPVPGVQPA